METSKSAFRKTKESNVSTIIYDHMFEWQVYNNINFERKCQEKQQHTSTLLKYIPRLQCEGFYKVHVNYIQRRCEKMRIIKIDAGKTCQPFWYCTILKMFSGIWINQNSNWDGEIHNLFAMLLTKK